jgi:hypothetical protein
LFACFISDLVLDEASGGDSQQASLRLKALEGIPKLAATIEGERLAAAFLANAIPANAAGDAAHLAIAIVGKVEIPADVELHASCKRAAIGPDRADLRGGRIQTAEGLHPRGTDGNFDVWLKIPS